MPDANRVLSLLGSSGNSPELDALFQELKTIRRPELDPADRDVYTDFVLIRRQGLELGFIDEPFFRAEAPEKRRRNGSGLMMYQAYFYNQLGDILPFPDKLPFGLDWSDQRESVRRKIDPFALTRRSYIKDAWELPAFNLSIEYAKQDGNLFTLVCQLPYDPWPEDGRLQPSLTPKDWLGLFGSSLTSPELRDRLEPLNITEVIETCDDAHEIDFRIQCGLVLIFTKRSNLTLPGTPLSRSTDMVLGSVTFLGSRQRDARQWAGELPLGLTFEDSPVSIAEKVGRPPDKRHDDRIVGSAFWRLDGYDLHVQYSTVENYVTEISLMAPGYRR